jgi:hypothetical protein
MGREDFSQSSQLSTLVGKPTNRYQKLPKNVNTLRRLTEAKAKPNNRYHYSIYPLVQKEYQASYTQLTNLDFYSPIITIKGSAIVSHLIGTTYEDAGVTVDEGSTLISTVSTVDDTKFGIYSVTYTSTDGINPDTTVVRTVKVGLPPDVTINGQNPFNLEKFDVYVDSGVTINDSNSTLISTTSTVNNLAVGTYTVNYTVSNPAFTEVFSRTVRVDDTIPPVITIAGDNPYTLERFDVYTDPGATVDLGSELTNTDLTNVQNTAIGSFDVVYTAYDGNTTVTATRTVNVVDTVPPVITILGDDPYTLERFDVYTDEGATVDAGSVLTTDVSAVNNTLIHGSSFEVTYTATDGNTAHDVTQTRTVNIVDTKPPVITLLGDVDPYQIQPAIPFQDVDPGFEVDLGTSVSVDYSNVVTTDNSNFDVVYRASDGVNPDTVVIRRVAVADTLSPIVILNGPSVVTLERYAEYVEQSVTLDPGSSLVSTTTDLDNTTVGSYTVTYLATDNINPDTTNVRTINVVDTTAPIVTLNGTSSVTLERYGVFADTDPGVTIDANGTLVSVDISQLDNTTQGAYTVTYNVVDDHNNANVITREVVVEDTVPPVVTLNNESTSYTLERYGDWSAIDPGVTVDRGSYLHSVTVDNTSTGLKVVSYTVKDGTNTTVKNRIITVEDTTAPVITLDDGDIGTTDYTVQRGTTYVDPGATADTGETVSDNRSSNLNMTVSGTYIVTYSATDVDGNTGTVDRIVIVEDTTAPVITLDDGDIGTTDYTVERGTTYVDPGATADGGETVSDNRSSNLNMAVSGTYIVTYSATDVDGNTGTVDRIVIVEDTTAPVITLDDGDIGTTDYTVQRGTTYVDPGATADTGETVSDNRSSNLNMAVSGTYIVTYSATDVDGNTGTADRIVIVEDTTAPVITLDDGDIGTTDYTVQRGTTYVDPGATADTGETVSDNRSSNLNMAVSGTYIVTYSATDVDGNTGTADRIVIVEDTTAPVITLDDGDIGTTDYTVQRGTTYVDPGATADTGETVSDNRSSNLNMAVSGTYIVTYSATDVDGNTGTADRIVIVEDTTAPVITLDDGDIGTTDYTVERGTTYVDPGATADTGETVSDNRSSNLNMAVSGTYIVTYSATDVDGNTGTADRIVIVEDTTAPVITLDDGDIGTTDYTVERGTTYVDPGATADGGETVSDNRSSNLNMAVSGTYIVTYSATDVDGNTGTADRTVIVLSGWPQQQKIQATDKQGGDLFGWSVSISEDGNTAIVGAPDEDTDVSAAGAAYIFTWSETSSSWSEQQKIQASDKQQGDYFGSSVAISDDGNTVIVGAQWEDAVVGSNTIWGAGAAYIFTWSETSSSWSEQQKIQASDKQMNAYFGESVAISGDGNTAIVGAQYEDTPRSTDTGAAYIFTWSETSSSWSEQQKIQALDKQAGDYFGSSVAISDDGNTAIVGARGEDSYFAGEAGAAYIFTWSETSSSWSEQQKIQASDKQGSDYFGESVAISGDGNTAIVGARLEDDTGGTDAGAAYIFTWSETSSSWSEQQKIQASDKQGSDWFGGSVAISDDGNTAIVGARLEDPGGTSDAGATYIFTRSGTSWSEQQKIQASDKEGGDLFGSFVAISGDGNTAIVGATNEDTGGGNAGAAYMYRYIF